MAEAKRPWVGGFPIQLSNNKQLYTSHHCIM